jgi:hypothetical protein
MGTSKTKTKTKKKTAVAKRAKAAPVDSYFYASESVKDFDFADYVKVSSSPRGMLLSFGKGHPDTNKAMIIREVFLPLDVAHSLKAVIKDQFELLLEQGSVRVEIPEDSGKGDSE